MGTKGPGGFPVLSGGGRRVHAGGACRVRRVHAGRACGARRIAGGESLPAGVAAHSNRPFPSSLRAATGMRAVRATSRKNRGEIGAPSQHGARSARIPRGVWGDIPPSWQQGCCQKRSGCKGRPSILRGFIAYVARLAPTLPYSPPAILRAPQPFGRQGDSGPKNRPRSTAASNVVRSRVLPAAGGQEAERRRRQFTRLRVTGGTGRNASGDRDEKPNDDDNPPPNEAPTSTWGVVSTLAKLKCYDHGREGRVEMQSEESIQR